MAGILPPAEIEFLIQRARQYGAFISQRAAEGGGEVPYEINSTWYSALNMDNCGEERAFQVKRFVASRSIALALRGVPGIYFHGLIGSRNDVQLALRTKTKRDVNRTVVDEAYLARNLGEPGSKLNHISDQLGRLLEMRVRHKAFHPNAEQQVLLLSPSVFAVLRTSPGGDEHILALTNITERTCRLVVSPNEIGLGQSQWYDLVSGRGWMARDSHLTVDLQPYDVLWLMPFSELERSIESPA